MIKDFEDIIKYAKERGTKTLAVAVAQDLEVLRAVDQANQLGIVKAILIGDQQKIEEIAKNNHINLENYEMIDEKEIIEASRKAVELVSSGKAHIVMKGLVDTAIILKAVLDKEIGLRTGNVLSHTGVFDVPNYDRLIFVTDAAMNIAPDLKTKKQIIENAVQVAHALDIVEPKIAVLCAKEKVEPKMIATVEAQELEKMNKEGNIKECLVGGPLALDNAISEEAAKHKKIIHPVAGKADILVVPNIEAGNVLYKSMVFFGKAKNAGIIVGAKAPIVLTSRADSDTTKLNSIALAVLMAAKTKNEMNIKNFT
jgi:phosphate butyryltransferase